MYIQYKKQQIANKNLKKKIENEQGITFKPNINVNSNISVNTSFYERNQLQLNKKIIAQNQYSNDNNNKRKFSPEKIDEIISDIHVRLYRRGLEKQLNRSKITENKYSKRNINNSTSLRNTDMHNNYTNYRNNIRSDETNAYNNDVESNIDHNYYKMDPDIRNVEEDETIKETYKNVEDSQQAKYQFVEDLDI